MGIVIANGLRIRRLEVRVLSGAPDFVLDHQEGTKPVTA